MERKKQEKILEYATFNIKNSNKNDPEQIVEEDKLIKSDFQFAESNNFSDKKESIVYDYPEIESDEDSDEDSDDMENLPKNLPKISVEFQYERKGEIYGYLEDLQIKAKNYLKAERSYLLACKKYSSPTLVLFRNFLTFLEKFEEGVKSTPVFRDIGSVVLMREELAMFTLKFLMAENDYRIIKKTSSRKSEFMMINNKKQHIIHEVNGSSKKIYHLLLRLMNSVFIPTLEYKSSQFRDIYSTNTKLMTPVNKSFFSHRDSASAYIKASFYNPNIDKSNSFKEIKNISLNEIVFPIKHNPLEVFKEQEIDVPEFIENVKNIIYTNLDFFRAAFDLNHPDLFQQWAKQNVADIQPLSSLLRDAISEDIKFLIDRIDIAQHFIALDTEFEVLRMPKVDYFTDYRKNMKNIIRPILDNEEKILNLIYEYTTASIAFLNELENALPVENNFEGVLNSIYQSLQKAESTGEPDYIISGFYAYSYNVNNFYINRNFLKNFVSVINENEKFIDHVAQKWRDSLSLQRFFNKNLSPISMRTDEVELSKDGSIIVSDELEIKNCF